MEVLKLVANGMTNSGIMTKLVPSENTVKGHVSNMLSKLHLADRTQVAVLAWRTISDLAGSEEIGSVHLAEALQYRPKLLF